MGEMELSYIDEARPVDEDAYLRDFLRAVEHKDLEYIQFVVPIIKDQRDSVLKAIDYVGNYLDLSAEDCGRYNSILSLGLIKAAHCGFTQIVQYLLDQGTEVCAANADGNTALIKAAERGHLIIVKILVAYGADVNQTNLIGSSALQWISRFTERHQVVQFLLQRPNIDINTSSHKTGMTALHCSAKYENSIQNLRALLKAGAKVNARTRCAFGWTPLHLAAVEGRWEACRLLLRYGAEPNSGDLADGLAPLHLACQHGQARTVHILLDGSADPNLKAKCGRTPLERMLCYSRGWSQSSFDNMYDLMEADNLASIAKEEESRLNSVVSDVCERLSEASWMGFFLQLLGGDGEKLEEALRSVPCRLSEHSLPVAAHHALTVWRRTHPHTATFWVLVRALCDHEMMDTAKGVIQRHWNKW